MCQLGFHNSLKKIITDESRDVLMILDQHLEHFVRHFLDFVVFHLKKDIKVVSFWFDKEEMFDYIKQSRFLPGE